MKTLRESILDDEEDLAMDDDVLIDSWLNKHIDPNDNWHTFKSLPGQNKVYKKTNDGYDLYPHTFMYLELGEETTIPEYINLKNGHDLSISTNSTKLIIDSKYITNFLTITIDGDNLQTIEINGKMDCQVLDIYGSSLKTISIPKGKVGKLKTIKCPELILPKCKLPKISNEFDISEDSLKSLYSVLKINPDIIKVHK